MGILPGLLGFPPARPTGDVHLLAEPSFLNNLLGVYDGNPQLYIPFWIVILISIGAIGAFFLFVFISFTLIAPRCGCGGKPSSSYCPNRAASQDCYDPASGQLGAFSSNIEMSGMDGQFGVRSQCD